MPLYSTEISNQGIQNASADSDTIQSPLEENDLYTSHVWAINTPNSHDILDQTFSFDESIMEVMNISERPWEEMHHRSLLISKLDSLEFKPKIFYLDDDMERYQFPIQTHNRLSERHFKNI